MSFPSLTSTEHEAQELGRPDTMTYVGHVIIRNINMCFDVVGWAAGRASSL